MSTVPHRISVSAPRMHCFSMIDGILHLQFYETCEVGDKEAAARDARRFRRAH